MDNYYEILGIQREETSVAIKNAFRAKMEKSDIYEVEDSDKAAFLEKTEKEIIAYCVMIDKEEHQHYDQCRAEGQEYVLSEKIQHDIRKMKNEVLSIIDNTNKLIKKQKRNSKELFLLGVVVIIINFASLILFNDFMRNYFSFPIFFGVTMISAGKGAKKSIESLKFKNWDQILHFYEI